MCCVLPAAVTGRSVEPCAREDCGFYADRRNQITGQAGPLDFCQAGGTHEIFL